MSDPLKELSQKGPVPDSDFVLSLAPHDPLPTTAIAGTSIHVRSLTPGVRWAWRGRVCSRLLFPLEQYLTWGPKSMRLQVSPLSRAHAHGWLCHERLSQWFPSCFPDRWRAHPAPLLGSEEASTSSSSGGTPPLFRPGYRKCVQERARLLRWCPFSRPIFPSLLKGGRQRIRKRNTLRQKAQSGHEAQSFSIIAASGGWESPAKSFPTPSPRPQPPRNAVAGKSSVPRAPTHVLGVQSRCA